MRFRTFSTCALVCACWLTAASGVSAAVRAQDNKQAAPKVSAGEAEAADKINKAKGGEAKLQAAAEFIQKYPKSSLRPRIAEAVANEIAGTEDVALKISLAQTYLDFFKEPGEAEQVNATLLSAYIDAGRADDAFKMAGARLEKNPEDVDLLKNLAIIASNEVIKGNASFAAQGQQYGAKAIELMEADKRPASVDAAKWTAYKAEALPALYRATGIIAYKTNDSATALARFEKAVALKTADPNVYFLLTDLSYTKYEQMAKQYQVMAAGPEKQAALKQVEAQLDKVIDVFAQAVALTEGDPQYQTAHDQLKKDLETYYKYRHNSSTDGLQQLIDKYKKPPTPMP